MTDHPLTIPGELLEEAFNLGRVAISKRPYGFEGMVWPYDRPYDGPARGIGSTPAGALQHAIIFAKDATHD